MLTDVNDNDPVFGEDSYFFSFNENAVVGDIVGVVHAEDQDMGAGGSILNVWPILHFAISY